MKKKRTMKPNERPETYFEGGGKVNNGPHASRVPSAFPGLSFGEFTPEFSENEVEIVHISMNSTMGDTISVRAQYESDKIIYDVCDEYESGFDFEPSESTQPLTFKEMTDFLWSITYGMNQPLFRTQWEEIQYEDNEFFSLDSDFYPGLQEWLDTKFRDCKDAEARQRRDRRPATINTPAEQPNETK